MIHLRFHRRGPSNPTSPAADRTSWDPTVLQSSQLHLTPDDTVPAPDVRPRSAISLSFPHANPPVLPPINRSDLAWPQDGQESEQKSADAKHRDDSKSAPKSPHPEQSSSLGSQVLGNYRREQATNPPISQREPLNAPMDSFSVPRSSPPLAIPGRKGSASAKSALSFASPTDLQNTPSTAKRLLTEPSISPNPPAGRDASKTKKTLPFLKNPVSSLLLRRKTNQNPPNLALPLPKRLEEPTYDPRIRGTRVHDFSAPRPWKPIVQPPNIGCEPVSAVASHVPLTPNKAPPVPPKDDTSGPSRTSSSHSKGLSIEPSVQTLGSQVGSTQRKKSSLFSRISMSRNVSATSAKSSRSTLSAIPRHMKSTSSRFSFDMIGAAEQEKILEERHRQRQQDKGSEMPCARRDSRFDEFDDDTFDYDAMNDDDDLEERIPGVNADFEEDFNDEFDDPDNDQENFAGFSFQRSEPTSSLTTPHSTGVAPTPRDASGYIVGEDQIGETTEETTGHDHDQQPSPCNVSEDSPKKAYSFDSSTGPGIQGREHPDPAIAQAPAPRPEEKIQLSKDDELYFNDGLIHDFDGEGDGSAFDESIFDLNDTDKYGRPIPGMFANALAQRAAPPDTKRRESDIVSRVSGHSIVSQSTAHTSISAGTHPPDEAGISHAPQPQAPEQTSSHIEDDPIVAYQAALAAAAHKAAASGKFRRNVSPDPPTERSAASPSALESSQTQPNATGDEPLASYDYDDEFSTGLDDYELDDDYITAEANASVLANDFDGWYGQEFGFYSAPLPQSSHVHGLLSEKNLYQYSNGGYFGPSGLNRSLSGRLVSREPNLTPITERSEYSNRNSLMSNGWPQVPNGSNPIQSPGLAQLAMMAEDQDISLAGLLRLRNKAWGGSQVSLTSSREGSPYDRNDASTALSQELSGISLAPGRNSAFSYYGHESAGAGSSPESPTLTMALPNAPTNPIPSIATASNLTTSLVTAPVFPSSLTCATVFPPLSEAEELNSPESAGKSAQTLNEGMVSTVGGLSKQRPNIGHKHNRSSGSISYVKEDDSGETRWIIERRRTGESGELELLEREVVDGGRI